MRAAQKSLWGWGRAWLAGWGWGLAPGKVTVQEAAVAQQASPELHAHDAEDEEDEEAQQEHVSQHGQGVQQQRDQDTHACR